MNYTNRDHDTYLVLRSHEDEDGDIVIPNAQLAKALGITAGAAVPRLDRLKSLGVIEVTYDINPYNGNVKRRTIVLLTHPTAPFKAETDQPKAVTKVEKPAPEPAPEPEPVGKVIVEEDSFVDPEFDPVVDVELRYDEPTPDSEVDEPQASAHNW